MLLHVLVAVSLSVPAGPGGPGKGVRAAYPGAVTVTASEYRFMAPSTLPEGSTVLTLVNRGKQVHHVTLLRLEGGKRAADLEAALRNPGPPPAWAVPVGGPNAVNPGGSSTDIVNLEPGQYALACFVPGPDGVPHLMHGMVKDLKVVASERKSAPEPAPDVTAELADYGFTFSRELTAGRHRVLVRNSATQPHELVLVRLADGKHANDFIAWAQAGMKTVPPGDFVGGVSPIAPGIENEALLDLSPGNYLLICFLEDAKDQRPHFAHGMIRELTVR